jgi:hypothetical protein
MKIRGTLFLLVLLCPYFLNAQNRINYFPDSVRIELPKQHALVVLEMADFKSDSAIIRQLPILFSEWLGYVTKSSPSNFSSTGPYRVDIRVAPGNFREIMSGVGSQSYKPVGEKTLISITPVERPSTSVVVRDNQIVELLPPGWEVMVSADRYKLKVYAESFEGLQGVAGENFAAASDAISNDEPMKHVGKKSIRGRLVLQDGKVLTKDLRYIYPGDNIFLSADAGVGLYGDKIYPELSAKFGLTFKDHFNRKFIRTSLVLNNLFFAEKATEGYDVNVNSFLSVSFERNFNKKFDRPHWAGLGAGFLVNRNGSYFQGNTARFFISHDAGRFDIVPEFYLTDGFKKFAFGMTLRYGF